MIRPSAKLYKGSSRLISAAVSISYVSMVSGINRLESILSYSASSESEKINSLYG